MLTKYSSIVPLQDYPGLIAIYTYLHRGMGIFNAETADKLTNGLGLI